MKRGLNRISVVHQMRCTGRPLSRMASTEWRPQTRSVAVSPAWLAASPRGSSERSEGGAGVRERRSTRLKEAGRPMLRGRDSSERCGRPAGGPERSRSGVVRPKVERSRNGRRGLKGRRSARSGRSPRSVRRGRSGRSRPSEGSPSPSRLQRDLGGPKRPLPGPRRPRSCFGSKRRSGGGHMGGGCEGMPEDRWKVRSA